MNHDRYDEFSELPDRRVADRRISPAIKQIPPLAAEIDRLREVNAGLLAALRAIQMRAKAHEDDTDTDRKRYLFHIEQTARAAIVKAQIESAAAQASPSVAAAVYVAPASAADHDDRPMSAIVIAKCIGCGAKREVTAGEIAPGDQPMCDCGMPMIAHSAKVRRDFHDDKPDGLPNMHVSTGPGDLDLAGRPLKPGT